MHLVLITALLLAAVFGPRLWVGYVMRRHGRDIPGLPGTGGELATHLIDAATLTGAVSIALGAVNIGLMSNNESLQSHITASGREIGEQFWALPMNDEYLEPMKGDLSDLRNAGTDRKAGTITAAKFLEQFVDDTPWAHLDIAGTANLDKGLPNAPKGASGIAVRSLVRAVETWANGGLE